MGRLDTSKAGELRVMAERLRRQADEMILVNYVDMMCRAAAALDAEAAALEYGDQMRPGHRLDIRI